MSVTEQQPNAVGRRVRFSLGNRQIEGTIAADRGPVGSRQRRIFTVHVAADPYDPVTVELPEDELTYVEEGPRPTPAKAEIIEFLKEGGLLSILRANLSGGPRQPHVWLCLDSHSNVTYTFAAKDGALGGGAVPFWALQDESIFTPKRDEVLNFVAGFGLSQAEAEDVVRSVGIAP